MVTCKLSLLSYCLTMLWSTITEVGEDPACSTPERVERSRRQRWTAKYYAIRGCQSSTQCTYLHSIHRVFCFVFSAIVTYSH